ncbi:hypothetical protein M0805_000129 [Coniferiporia weirii]|nr:hypothetical protein M0805_000129 [Coniferiporia weirii]
MSLTRHFLHELRPLFRMLDEPLGLQHPAFRSVLSRQSGSPFALGGPFFGSGFVNAPAIDLSEESNAYVVEAELPGVKRENIEVRIGDNGRSLTIEGRTFTRSGAPASEGEEKPNEVPAPSSDTPSTNGEPQAVAQTGNAPTVLSTERTFSSSSSFSRTIWLPSRVDGSDVSAKLVDGILTVRIPKAEVQESTKITIE